MTDAERLARWRSREHRIIGLWPNDRNAVHGDGDEEHGPLH
jgi:hypothetical protein